MTKYIVKAEWAGYSRGDATWLVEADTPEEAEEYFYEGTLLTKKTIRDDTESEALSVKIANDEGVAQ